MKKNLTWLVFAMLLAFFSCKKDRIEREKPDDPSEIIDSPEALSPDEAKILDNMPEATSFNTSSIALPNGEPLDRYLQEVNPVFYNLWMSTDAVPKEAPYENLGPQDAKNLLIARISIVALNLTDRSKHQNGSQNGLAYSWGSKDHTILQAPPGFGSFCTPKSMVWTPLASYSKFLRIQVFQQYQVQQMMKDEPMFCKMPSNLLCLPWTK